MALLSTPSAERVKTSTAASGTALTHNKRRPRSPTPYNFRPSYPHRSDSGFSLPPGTHPQTSPDPSSYFRQFSGVGGGGGYSGWGNDRRGDDGTDNDYDSNDSLSFGSTKERELELRHKRDLERRRTIQALQGHHHHQAGGVDGGRNEAEAANNSCYPSPSANGGSSNGRAGAVPDKSAAVRVPDSPPLSSIRNADHVGSLSPSLPEVDGKIAERLQNWWLAKVEQVQVARHRRIVKRTEEMATKPKDSLPPNSNLPHSNSESDLSRISSSSTTTTTTTTTTNITATKADPTATTTVTNNMCKRNGTFIDKESTYRSANLQKHQSFDLSSEVAVKFQMETNRKINESPDFEKFRASFTKDLVSPLTSDCRPHHHHHHQRPPLDLPPSLPHAASSAPYRSSNLSGGSYAANSLHKSSHGLSSSPSLAKPRRTTLSPTLSESSLSFSQAIAAKCLSSWEKPSPVSTIRGTDASSSPLAINSAGPPRRRIADGRDIFREHPLPRPPRSADATSPAASSPPQLLPKDFDQNHLPSTTSYAPGLNAQKRLQQPPPESSLSSPLDSSPPLPPLPPPKTTTTPPSSSLSSSQSPPPSPPSSSSPGLASSRAISRRYARMYLKDRSGNSLNIPPIAEQQEESVASSSPLKPVPATAISPPPSSMVSEPPLCDSSSSDEASAANRGRRTASASSKPNKSGSWMTRMANALSSSRRLAWPSVNSRRKGQRLKDNEQRHHHHHHLHHHHQQQQQQRQRPPASMTDALSLTPDTAPTNANTIPSPPLKLPLPNLPLLQSVSSEPLSVAELEKAAGISTQFQDHSLDSSPTILNGTTERDSLSHSSASLPVDQFAQSVAPLVVVSDTGIDSTDSLPLADLAKRSSSILTKPEARNIDESSSSPPPEVVDRSVLDGTSRINNLVSEAVDAQTQVAAATTAAAASSPSLSAQQPIVLEKATPSPLLMSSIALQEQQKQEPLVDTNDHQGVVLPVRSTGLPNFDPDGRINSIVMLKFMTTVVASDGMVPGNEEGGVSPVADIDRQSYLANGAPPPPDHSDNPKGSEDTDHAGAVEPPAPSGPTTPAVASDSGRTSVAEPTTPGSETQSGTKDERGQPDAGAVDNDDGPIASRLRSLHSRRLGQQTPPPAAVNIQSASAIPRRNYQGLRRNKGQIKKLTQLSSLQLDRLTKENTQKNSNYENCVINIQQIEKDIPRPVSPTEMLQVRSQDGTLKNKWNKYEDEVKIDDLPFSSEDEVDDKMVRDTPNLDSPSTSKFEAQLLQPREESSVKPQPMKIKSSAKPKAVRWGTRSLFKSPAPSADSEKKRPVKSILIKRQPQTPDTPASDVLMSPQQWLMGSTPTTPNSAASVMGGTLANKSRSRVLAFKGRYRPNNMPVIVVKRFHYIDDDEYDDDDDEEEEEEEEEEEDHGLEFDEDFEEDGFVSGDSNDSSVNENGDDSESCSYADSDWGSDNAPGFLNSDSD